MFQLLGISLIVIAVAGYLRRREYERLDQEDLDRATRNQVQYELGVMKDIELGVPSPIAMEVVLEALDDED